MALVPDQKFSTFQDGGDLEVGDIIVGLRGGLNTKFNFTGDLPPGVIVPVAQGGTGHNTVITVPTATTYAGWDGNKNLSANNFLPGFATNIANAGTLVLTVASGEIQEITGALTETVQLPDVTTLTAGHTFKIINNSSGNVTVTSSGGNTIQVMAANTTMYVTCVLITGTTAASWNGSYVFDNGAGVLSITGTANQVNASASTGAVTLSLPQSIATNSAVQFGSLQLGASTLINGVINDGTLATASATTAATSSSIKTYVDTLGGWVKLGSQTAVNVASMAFTSMMSSTYYAYKLIIEYLQPATNGQSPLIQLSTNNGSTYVGGASDYSYRLSFFSASFTDLSNFATNAIAFGSSVGNASITQYWTGEILFIDPTNAVRQTVLLSQSLNISSAGTLTNVIGFGQRNAAEAHNAFIIAFSSGNIANITATLYGMKA